MDLTLLFQLKIIFILKVQNTFELKVSCLKYILFYTKWVIFLCLGFVFFQYH
jgi:hypothetical protein